MKRINARAMSLAAVAILGVAAIPATVSGHGGYGGDGGIEIGDPVPGLTPAEQALFFDGKSIYERDITVAEGVGPQMNGRSCSTCHAQPVTGGSDVGISNNGTQFGVLDEGRFFPVFFAGGPMVQTTTIAGDPEVPNCTMQPDGVPPLPGVITSSRHPAATFGLGLLDAVEDAEILKWQGKRWWKHESVIGMPNWGVELEGLRPLRAVTLAGIREQPSGPSRIGRFGWKAQTATVFQFSAEPASIELGVTSPWFWKEFTPDDGPVPAECDAADHAINDPDNQLALKISYFQTFLGAPERKAPTFKSILGEVIFHTIGCSDCHRKTMKTGDDYYVRLPDGTPHRVEALSGKTIHPWSDLLLHDMGDMLNDNRQQGLASGRFWRTTPLWGVRHKTRLLHDGSVDNFHDAIFYHGGEAQHARDKYLGLSSFEQYLVHEFLGSL